MMEVQRQSLQSVRHSDKKFSPKGVPSVSTGLSLGVNGMDSTNTTSSLTNTGYISSTRTPLPNATAGVYEMQQPPMAGAPANGNQRIPTPPLVPVGDGDFMSLSPPGIISGNHAVFLSPSSVEMPPSVSTAGVGGTMFMMAQDVPSELQPESEVIVSRNFRQSLSRHIPSVAALDTEKATEDVDPHLSMATEPDSLEMSKPDLNVGYNDGETQIVGETQLGVDVMQRCLAGETQPVDDEDGFDDMVVLQNDTLTASTTPMENDNQPSLLHEPLQIVDTPPLEASLDVTTSAPSGITESKILSNRDEYDMGKDIGVEPHINKLFSGELANERVLDTEGPAAAGGQARKEEGIDTSEPQEGASQDRSLDNQENKDQLMHTENSNVGNANTKRKEVVAEEDIQAIMGRKVIKKFGRKNYKGKVVDFDTENQWFKVVYEDGDQEDLELVEVKEILLTGDDIISDTTTATRKKPLTEGHPRKQARKQKIKSQIGKKSRGRPKKKGSSTRTKLSQKVPSSKKLEPEGSKAESLLRKSTDEVEMESQSQAKNRDKRKRSSDVETEQRTRTGAKVKKGRNSRSSSRKTSIRKRSPKTSEPKLTKKDSGNRKATRRRSLSSLPAERKRDKRRKVDASDELESFVGKMLEKDFDGTLYKGKVMKFDKKTKYYKVKYEDGDQEDLELEELKAVLVD